jgi:hypothetical protein
VRRGEEMMSWFCGKKTLVVDAHSSKSLSFMIDIFKISETVSGWKRKCNKWGIQDIEVTWMTFEIIKGCKAGREETRGTYKKFRLVGIQGEDYIGNLEALYGSTRW